MKKCLLALAVFLLVACSDKQDKDITDPKTGVTYQSEPDSPWGSFILPIKEAEYTIQAPASQQSETLVQWTISVENTGESLNIDVDKMEYPEGTIRSYNRSRNTFKVSARDGADYWFTIANIDWIVRTNITSTP